MKKKLHFKYWNCLHSHHIENITMGLPYRDFQYLKCKIFFHGSSLLWIWGLSSKAQVIWSLLSTRTENCFWGQNRSNVVAVERLPMLKVSIFFPQIIIISLMRLKFQSCKLLDHQNMSKPIPYCSNLNKIVFWA